MSTHPEADRETRRALLREALDQLREAPDDRSADDVVRALDAYLDARVPSPPAADPRGGDRSEGQEIRWATWLVLGVGVFATIIAALTIGSGGWPAGLAIAAIWIVAAFALMNT